MLDEGSWVAFLNIFVVDEQSGCGQVVPTFRLPSSGWGTYYTGRMLNQH